MSLSTLGTASGYAYNSFFSRVPVTTMKMVAVQHLQCPALQWLKNFMRYNQQLVPMITARGDEVVWQGLFAASVIPSLCVETSFDRTTERSAF